MADFINNFWPWFIIVPTVVGILAMFGLILWLGKSPPSKTGEAVKTMGHVWDGDLAEYNNPLPRWWLNLFYITLFFAIGYLALYPGLGRYAGVLGWTSTGEYDAEMQDAAEHYEPIYRKYLDMDLREVALDAQAQKIGRRLFVTYCAQCHGSDAGGARGFPNLRDGDWLHGGEPDTIKTTILDGRSGAMPAWEQPLGGYQGVANVAQYVMSLSGRKTDTVVAAKGKEKFDAMCSACHGPEGKGNPAMGAPNLTDVAWLYGGTEKQIIESIAKGRNGRMPAHRDMLGEARAHLLAAYVYGLSAARP
jgi:cytochrome c oxidase cbb3-type subunit 3